MAHTTNARQEKERMVHIRLDARLHRELRLLAAKEDTTLQGWISRALQNAVEQETMTERKV